MPQLFIVMVASGVCASPTFAQQTAADAAAAQTSAAQALRAWDRYADTTGTKFAFRTA